MSRAENAVIRNLGKIARGTRRGTRRGTTPAQMFLMGRRAGLAWAHRSLNRNLAADIQPPETADDDQLRSWLRGFGAGVTSAAMEDGGHEPDGQLQPEMRLFAAFRRASSGLAGVSGRDRRLPAGIKRFRVL